MWDLKPCPFCGSRNVALADSFNNAFNRVVHVRCRSCGCRTENKIEERSAVAAWNQRADECHGTLYDMTEKTIV